MQEIKGNMWSLVANAHFITTNGYVKKDGSAVMGRGCAKEAADRWTYLPAQLGDHISRWGNHVYRLADINQAPIETLWSFPVKHHWREEADLELIERSAKEADMNLSGHYKKVILPRPGCGNGKLEWEDVKEVLEPILDDRFYIVDFS